jgi:hypothetical protein
VLQIRNDQPLILLVEMHVCYFSTIPKQSLFVGVITRPTAYCPNIQICTEVVPDSDAEDGFS